jgi:hypothetical protein
VDALVLVDCEPEVDAALLDVPLPLPEVCGPCAVLGPFAPVLGLLPPAPVGASPSSLQLVSAMPEASAATHAQRKESPNFIVLRR